jgi:hypothetical protein
MNFFLGGFVNKEDIVMVGLTRYDKSSKKLNKIFITILTTCVASTKISL